VFVTNLADISGIAETYAQKLHAAGVPTVEALLEKGATPAGRGEIAEAGGIGHAQILTWVSHADLFRIRGVAGEYAELLEASGVDTVVELAQRNPEHLTEKMGQVNQQKSLVRLLPTEEQVAGWIRDAKALPRAVTY
jgi:predicted flap endonuclease-1-like 5' DNA nuclease